MLRLRLLLVSTFFVSVHSLDYFVLGDQYFPSFEYDNGIENMNEIEEEEPVPVTAKPGFVFGCNKGRLVERKPTRMNAYTSHWCFTFWLDTHPINATGADENCKNFLGTAAALTLPESQAEVDLIKSRVNKLFLVAYNMTNVDWTLVVDGYRRPECKNPPDGCKVEETFYLNDERTDSEFIAGNWVECDPDNHIYNGTTKDCLGLDNSGKLRNIFCDRTTSPYIKADGQPEYSIYGHLCGAPAIEKPAEGTK